MTPRGLHHSSSAPPCRLCQHLVLHLQVPEDTSGVQDHVTQMAPNCRDLYEELEEPREPTRADHLLLELPIHQSILAAADASPTRERTRSTSSRQQVIVRLPALGTSVAVRRSAQFWVAPAMRGTVNLSKPMVTARLSAGPLLIADGIILELLPAAAYVCAADGTIVRYNRKAVELWGRAPSTRNHSSAKRGLRRF
jgi:hypothetical protein